MNGERRTKAVSGGMAMVAPKPPAAWIVPQGGKEEGKVFPLGAWNVLGASADRCNIVLDDDSVSSIHAVIQYDEGDWCLEDLGSTNKTWLDGEALTARRRVVGLHDGARIRIGVLEVTFKALRRNA